MLPLMFQSILFTSDDASLVVWWEGFEDLESGLQSLELALYKDLCGGNLVEVVPFEKLPFNETESTILRLALLVI